MKFTSTIVKGLIIGTSLFILSPLAAMQKPETKPTMTVKIIHPWYRKALELGISSPLKVTVLNLTGQPLKTLQQGQTQDYWFANIPNTMNHVDEYFNMDAWTKEYPQYLIRTAQRVYTLNFDKQAQGFKAILSKLHISPDLIAQSDDKQLMTLTKLLEKYPVQELEQIENGKALTVIADDNTANLFLSNN